MSIGLSPSFVSQCQKVQPLQLGALLRPAPTLWMEPACGPQLSDPSARTAAFQRRLASISTVPGATMPLSTSRPKATRGWRRSNRLENRHRTTEEAFLSRPSGKSAGERDGAPGRGARFKRTTRHIQAGPEVRLDVFIRLVPMRGTVCLER